MVDYFDPWRGANQGAQTLSTLSAAANADQQEMRQRRLADLQYNTANAAFQEAQKQREARGQLSTFLNTPQETTQQVSNPAYADYQQNLAAKMGPPQTMYPQGQAPLSGSLDAEMQGNGLSSLGAALQYPGQDITLPDKAPPQTVDQKSSQLPGITQQMEALSKYAMQTGDYDYAAKTLQYRDTLAKQAGEMKAAGSEDPVDYHTKVARLALNKSTGEQLEKGMAAIGGILDKGGITALNSMLPQIQQLPGFEKFDPNSVAVDPSNRFMSYDAGNGMSVIVDREHPKDFKVEPMTDISLFSKGYVQEHPKATYAEVSKAYQQHQLDKTVAQRTIIVNNPTKPATPATTSGSAGPLNEQGVNIGALDGLDPGKQTLIKKMANYEIPMPSSRTKENLALMARVALYDPSFDQQLYPIRQKLRLSFTSGPDAKNITSLNTAIHHLDELDKAVDNLGNIALPFGTQAWNAAANMVSSGSGSSRVTRVVNAKNAVEGELASVFKGTGATDQEIKAWDKGFNINGSPEQLKTGGVKEAVKLLQGRLDTLIDKYQTGMGTTKDLQILSQKSLDTLQNLGVNVDRYKAFAKGGNAVSPGSKPSTKTADPLGIRG